MNKDIDAQFLCKDCERYNLCRYYDRRKEDSYICKYFHLSETPKQKMGRWQYTGTYDEDGMLECSVCKREVDPSCYHYKFCPMCGAKMEGGAND